MDWDVNSSKWEKSKLKGMYVAVMCLRDGTVEERRVVSAVCQWLMIRAREMPESYNANWVENLPVDAWHSALLRRLLDGKGPLPERPEICMSYPVYPEED